jgi:hypothetical protein
MSARAAGGHHRYLENVPSIVPLLEKEYRIAAKRLEDTQEELNDLHPDKRAPLFALPPSSLPPAQPSARACAAFHVPRMRPGAHLPPCSHTSELLCVVHLQQSLA